MKTKPKDDRPSTAQIWITAARPHTLSASISPCLVAWGLTKPPLRLFGLWAIFCFTVQIGTNLHNDYADYVLGADTDQRIGPPRATARGWLTPQQTCWASTGTLTITFLSGVALLAMARQLENVFLWCIILSSIFNAFAYTGGPFPLGYLGIRNWSIGYSGLGEIFVFLYFGLAATLMLPYIMYVNGDRSIDWEEQLICGTQVGILAINIIVVNNMRDRLTDVHAGKRTTAVRFGRRFCEVEYMVCNILAFVLVGINVMRGGAMKPWKLLPLLSAVPALKETLSVLRKDGQDLNVHVGGAAKVQLLFSLLLAAGSD
jgi:1,4-dihydroxy-2-naphthoate polyprenyltransferase